MLKSTTLYLLKRMAMPVTIPILQLASATQNSSNTDTSNDVSLKEGIITISGISFLMLSMFASFCMLICCKSPQRREVIEDIANAEEASLLRSSRNFTVSL